MLKLKIGYIIIYDIQGIILKNTFCISAAHSTKGISFILFFLICRNTMCLYICLCHSFEYDLEENVEFKELDF
jgi:hypothetical protein